MNITHKIGNKIINNSAFSCKKIFVNSNLIDVLIPLKFACACNMHTIAQTTHYTHIHIHIHTITLTNSHIYYAHVYERCS